MASVEQEATSQTALADDVQAHLGKASRFADGTTRNWALFFFFRVLPQAELDKDLSRLKTLMLAMENKDAEATEEAAKELQVAIEHPAAMNAGVVEQAELDGDQSANAPSQLFLDWLKVLTGPQASSLALTLRNLLLGANVPESWLTSATTPSLSGSTSAGSAPAGPTPTGSIEAAVAPTHAPEGGLKGFELPDVMLQGMAVQAFQEMATKLAPLPAVLADPDKFKAFMAQWGSTAAQAGLKALSEGLGGVVFYEALRQMAPTRLKTDAAGAPWSAAMRSEYAESKDLPKTDAAEKEWDPAPVNFAFTYSGLTALGLDATTLASFPEPFKQGMAARSERLGDTGPSAPEYWEGVLGLDCVHGYFTGGFLVGAKDLSVPEKLWQQLRDDVRAFNERSGDKGRNLRVLLGIYFRLLGMEILHIELGQDPYNVETEDAKRLEYRKEHFGFRDGVSQPYIDMKLGDPPPGGGTPRRNRTWAPVAAGEIYLSEPDEDGNSHKLPLNSVLRGGSTFLVFRKLEQDVAAFRMFLGKQRPGNREAQRKLASQFVGRWPSGTPLVLAPDAPLELGDDPDGLLNNFLYAADDSMGQSCPLSAHIRRTNPRDIGGADDVRRHRILRRSIAYGGPLLADGVLGDGNKRGLLFIAANSRIDLQFELIQADWINKGEILGQAGLNRCPILGANQGGPADVFLEAGATAPVTGLPRFVVTRGGDYFFAPGLTAMKALAAGSKFEPDPGEVPFAGYSMGDTMTPALFSPDRMLDYAAKIIAGKPGVIRVAMPALDDLPSDPAPMAPVAFVGQLKDVKQVLSMRVRPEDGPEADRKIINSVAQYRATVERFSRGQNMFVSTEYGSDTEPRRKRFEQILEAAWTALGTDVYARLAEITKQNIEAALRRCGPSRRIDLVYDLASVATYEVVRKLYGIPGPSWLTELAVAMPFSQQHVSELQPEWLMAARAGMPDNPGLANLQIWSILISVDLIGNYQQQQILMGLSNQASSELMNHLDELITKARGRKAAAKTNLLAAFVALEDRFVHLFGYTPAAYYTDVRMLMLELVGTTMANIPATFGTVMDTVLDHNIPLTALLPILLSNSPMFPVPGPPPTYPKEDKDGVGRFIYETTRLNGTVKLLMRTCMQDDTLPSGEIVRKGDWIAALVGVAAFDPRGFPEPMRFSLRPFLPGQERKIENYLLFGARDGKRDCWGRDKLALYMVKECVKAAGRLQSLQKVAGAEGELKKFLQVATGLSARFTAVLPDWGAAPAPTAPAPSPAPPASTSIPPPPITPSA